MKTFLIASHGLSASFWLAYHLNQHPGMVCVHGSDRAVARDRDGLDLERLLETGGSALLYRKLQELRAGAESRQAGFERREYDQWMGGISPGAGVVGSVHTFRMRDLCGVEPSSLSGIAIGNLVRHPVSLVHSGHGLLSRSFLYDLNELRWTTDKVFQDDISFVESLAVEYDLKPGEIDTLGFFGACVMMRGLRLDVEACESMAAHPDYLGEFRMEMLTSDREAFAGLMSRISGGTLLCDGDYLDRVFESNRLNTHTNQQSTFTPARIWNRWTPWQQRAFRHYFEKYNIRSFYERIGYDFSFL